MKQLSHQRGTESTGADQSALRDRLAALRGPGRQPRPLDSRALTALAANPGCSRRALLDSAGVDKAALAEVLGAPANFGQSQFAFARGHAFEAGATRDGGAELVRLLCAHTGQAPPDPQLLECPDLTAEGPEGRIERTREALALAQARGQTGAEGGPGGWSVLLHPMVRLTVAGAPVCLEPDALVVDGDGGVTIVEIKSFPILDGSAAPTKVGAATRQAAVYGLALEAMEVRAAESVLLVCPKDFSNLPTAALVDMRKQLAAVRRQLRRLTRVEELTAALPAGTSFDLDLPPDRLAGAVDSVPAAYAPECLAGCDLAFHCRSQARTGNDPAVLGRGTRAELGALTTVKAALDAAHSDPPPPEPSDPTHPAGPSDPPDPAVLALRRAARLRAEVLGGDGAAGADGAGPAGGGPCR
nr:hypothetical protein [Streptomyces tardus]